MAVGGGTAPSRILEIGIVLDEVEPPVLRRVQVPAKTSLAGLHRVVQSAMGWADSHLHEFDVAGARYGPPDPEDGDEVGDEASVELGGLVDEGDRFDYVYDFGDGWAHTLTVEAVLAPEPGVRYPRCVSGQRACPPEDVGGPPGYEEFLAALADPAHPEHAECREWLGGTFDPAAFDVWAADAAVAAAARRRR